MNNRRQDREKNSLPSFDSCPFLWTAHRFLPIEQNRVTPADTVWSFNRFPSSWFYQRIYALETDSITYSKIVTCLIEWRVHLISLLSGGCFSVFKFLHSSQMDKWTTLAEAFKCFIKCCFCHVICQESIYTACFNYSILFNIAKKQFYPLSTIHHSCSF